MLRHLTIRRDCLLRCGLPGAFHRFLYVQAAGPVQVLRSGSWRQLDYCRHTLRRKSELAPQQLTEQEGEAKGETPIRWLPTTTYSIFSTDTQRILALKDIPKNLGKRQGGQARRPLIAILTTPAHAGLLESEDFTRRLIHTTFRRNRPRQRFCVVAAIVDSLPLPRTALKFKDSNSARRYYKIRRKEVEGMSFGIFDAEHAAPDLVHDGHERPDYHSSEARSSGPKVLNFTFDADKSSSQTVQSYVANTTFVNGKSGTLFARYYRWLPAETSESADEHQLMLEKEVDLTTVTINLQETCAFFEQAFNLSLEPLTWFRTVSDAAGNVIRRLASGPNEQVPASEELEKAIKHLQTSRHLQPHDIRVWALVRPEARAVGTDDSTESFDLGREFRSGSRLFKVISGGGGWGQKRGLLALDPDTSLTEEVPSDPEHLMHPAASLSEIYQEMIMPGQSVMFLLHKDIPQSERDKSVHGTTSATTALSSQSYCFGCTSSLTSSLPVQTGGPQNGSRERYHFLAKKYFGMLSELGMKLHRISGPHSKPVVTRSEGDEQNVRGVDDRVGVADFTQTGTSPDMASGSSQRGDGAWTTKLDVPGGTVLMQAVGAAKRQKTQYVFPMQKAIESPPRFHGQGQIRIKRTKPKPFPEPEKVDVPTSSFSEQGQIRIKRIQFKASAEPEKLSRPASSLKKQGQGQIKRVAFGSARSREPSTKAQSSDGNINRLS